MWKKAKTLCFCLVLRYFRGIPGQRDHLSPIHIHKHLLRICLNVKVIQMAPKMTLQL